jgi:hypothetical protein
MIGYSVCFSQSLHFHIGPLALRMMISMMREYSSYVHMCVIRLDVVCPWYGKGVSTAVKRAHNTTTPIVDHIRRRPQLMQEDRVHPTRTRFYILPFVYSDSSSNSSSVLSISIIMSNTAPIKWAQRSDSLYLTIALPGTCAQ